MENVENESRETPVPVPESGAALPLSPTISNKKTKSTFSVRLSGFLTRRRAVMGVVALCLIAGSSFWLFSGEEEQLAIKSYTDVYSFVPEKISLNASIPVLLPKGISKEIAKAHISFDPKVEGEWEDDPKEDRLVFNPKDSLTLGKYYSVVLDADEVHMKGDFYVDEDPKIEAIFPTENSEVHEDAEITIVFNRPMVPLTTLSELELHTLPVTVTPETPGRFKWVSARNLQFIPETTLIPSSEYTVTIGEGFTSLDGLKVEPRTHTFRTRPLRYDFVSSGPISYRAPIVIDFNQPVDLEKTRDLISVRVEEGSDLPLIISYGDKSTTDRKTGKEIKEEDTTKLFVYQKEDSHGREKLWDFDTNYFVTITGAYSPYGTEKLEERRIESFSVLSVVESIRAESPRTTLARPDFFDPKGTLAVAFYEDIDKSKTDIDFPGKHSVAYGTRCKRDDQGETVMKKGECEKEEDTKKLVLSFDENAFTEGQTFAVAFNKIYTTEGFRVNEEPLSFEVRTFAPLEIYRTVPGTDERAAALDKMIVCSNAPLKNPGEKGLPEYISSSNYTVYGGWNQSRYVYGKSEQDTCEATQFETLFEYGLLPETEYQLKVKLVDVFDRQTERTISFKTRSPEEVYTRFHNLQKQYNVTSPDKTTLTYAVENLEYMNMHICKLSPEAFLARTHKEMSRDFDDEEGSIGLVSGDCTEVSQKQISLPKKYWVNNYFQVNLKEYFADVRGHYVITFSNPLYKDSYTKAQLYDKTYVSVTNLVVGKKEVSRSDDAYTYSQSNNPAKNTVRDRALQSAYNLYWVSQGTALSPVLGASITQYRGGYRANFMAGALGTTDGQGVARAPADMDVMGAVVRYGDETAVVSDWADVLSYSQNARDASRTYIYTDRPMYRPGHTVNVRGIDRIGFDGQYEIWNKEPVTLTVYDSRAAKVYSTKLPVSAYGTFNTSFELPLDAPLGTYRIEAFGMKSFFDVEEYVPAAFKIETKSSKEEYISGDTIQVDVNADYYFGVPVQGGSVEYTATAQDYYFDRYTDEYFRFGADWYYCYRCGYGDNFLFRGETSTDDNGRAHIERTLSLDDYFKDGEVGSSKLVTISLTAKDVNGRSVSTQKSFIVHYSDFYIGVATDKYYTDTKTPVTLRVKTVDTTGKPLSKGGLSRTISKVTWNTFKRQEVDGGFYYRSEKELKEISKETLRTDNDGFWAGSLSFPEEGQYEVRVSGEDDRGVKVESVSSMFIYGSNVVSVPPNNNYELSIETDKMNVEVGDTASILIKSPYAKAKALVTIERGEIYEYAIVDVIGGLYKYEFPVTGRYAPNVYASVLLISEEKEVKYGSIEFTVGNKEHDLKVEVESNKKQYLPGESVTLTVRTKNSKGAPVPAEVSLAVADLSVLALKGNPKKNPALFFYDGFPLSVTTSANLKNVLYETVIPLGTKGGGGANADDLSKKKRGIFKDTAFWNASVITDERGEATVTFTLPDNLTSWQVESLGVTKNTELGVDYKEFGTKKLLMAVPLKPRFIVPGDTFSLGATVFNETDSSAHIAVSLSSDTLTFVNEKEDTIKVGAKESKTVYFTVKAPETMRAGNHTFVFKVSGSGLEDTVEQVIPIAPNTTYETVATANATNNDSATEYLYIPKEVVSDEGGLTIHANATMAVFMTNALEYMVTYPYGCSEQLSSSLSTIAIMKRAVAVPNVEGAFDSLEYGGVKYSVETVVKEGLTHIYEAQTEEGGFAYYKGLQPNITLTTHVLMALSELQKSGYEIRKDVLDRAASYLEKETSLQYVQFPDSSQDLVILSEYALRVHNGGKTTSLSPFVHKLIASDAFINERSSSMSLAYLGIMTAENFSADERSRVYTELTNRIDIDGRGAYLKSRSFDSWGETETSIKNTALLLKAFVAHTDEHTALPNVLRWLLASRDAAGVWGGTHNTFVVVDSMVDYLSWKHETESQFTLKGLLSGKEIFSYEFSPKNIFETFTHFISIDDFTREKVTPLVFERTENKGEKNNFYYDMALKYFLPVENIAPRDEGITISRDLFALTDTKNEKPIQEAKVGDVVRGKITVIVPESYQHVAIEDMIPAGFEIVNFNLSTEDQSLQDQGTIQDEYEYDYYGYHEMGYIPQTKNLGARLFDSIGSLFSKKEDKKTGFGFGVSARVPERMLRPSRVESHDDRVFLYTEQLAPGVYEYEYYLRALVPGTFKYLPARAEELYFPEVFGRTNGGIFTVVPN